tara:strand:+ start:955 stop:1242 length:288 start_codon:yes stop_codon:yes gene_type:complete
MKTVVYCKINGKKLKITNNSVEIEDSFLQVELVKNLIECKSITPIGKSALPLFFNKYLRRYKLSEVVFSEEKSPFVFDLDFEGAYIDNLLEGMAA